MTVMERRDIVAIGGSAGAIEGLGILLESMPRDLQAALFAVVHLAPDGGGHLARMLEERSALPVRDATDRAPIEPGVAYLAPADHHLIVGMECMYLTRGPRENRARPAVDPLFRSIALFHGPRAIGVILSGYLDDGTTGLAAIKEQGGLAFVEDPGTAVVPDMPASALEHVPPDWCGPVGGMGAALLDRVGESASMREPPSDASRESLRREVQISLEGSSGVCEVAMLGEPVPASCPECGGPLWELPGAVPRFRCHTGHGYTGRHLVEGLGQAEEQALWVALRVLEERARMLRRMVRGNGSAGGRPSPGAYEEKAKEVEEHVSQVRQLLGLTPSPPRLEPEPVGR